MLDKHLVSIDIPWEDKKSGWEYKATLRNNKMKEISFRRKQYLPWTCIEIPDDIYKQYRRIINK